MTGAVEAGIRILDDLSGGNRVRRNLVAGGLGTGVFVPVGAELNTIEGNAAEGHVLDGIRVEQAGNVLEKNRADANGAVGITAVPGTVDGGANRARGNGAAQCDGVLCP